MNTADARGAAEVARPRRHRRPPAADVRTIGWVAEQLGIGVSTAYRLAASGQVPGAFRVGAQWRVSTVAFWRHVHGDGDGHVENEHDGGFEQRRVGSEHEGRTR